MQVIDPSHCSKQAVSQAEKACLDWMRKIKEQNPYDCIGYFYDWITKRNWFFAKRTFPDQQTKRQHRNIHPPFQRSVAMHALGPGRYNALVFGQADDKHIDK